VLVTRLWLIFSRSQNLDHSHGLMCGFFTTAEFLVAFALYKL